MSSLERLRAIVARLRGPGGCPWDRKQTPQTLKLHAVEEAWELADAIERGDEAGWREELGDLLMQVFLHAQIAEERGSFDVEDVARGIADKLVRRHPHVFGDATVRDAAEVERRWEDHKRAEGRSLLDGVPRSMAALMAAERMGARAARIGFDWPDRAGVRAKVDEELRELDEALAAGDAGAVEHELGDLLFAVAQLARHAGVDAETALRHACDRFRERFSVVERHWQEAGSPPPGALPIEELETWWNQAKERQRRR